ncbi:EscU/YscU/HrcU family type III secretion system export apparatus switch protein [Pacificoceanicola onchidii]|uniref:EscU/YscU/HrcU family type III secretion system export apparatus switch protein n=1 Tax=Pacificoceanicola onchidii TaxID=2562685 RepID=UPI0010A5AECD|nr:flagellar type III secretion system protein FlhB [Pacificoceanicola onchidii]
MAEEEGAEKSHEPSPKKLEDARKKGEIARAPDLSTAMSYLGLLLCGLTLGAPVLQEFATALLPLIEQPDRLEALFFRDGATEVAGEVMTATLVPALPIFLVPGGMVLLTLLASKGILFTPSKLTPKGQRLNPISNAQNKYGRRGLFEFFKSFVKLFVYSVCLGMFLNGKLEVIVGSIYAGAAESTVMMMSLMMDFLVLVVLIAMVIGGIDFFWQRAEHLRKNRMTHKEVRDEFKESEGDPHFKQARRSRAQELAMRQMMGDVPEADVVIVNPTHYAVALKWSRQPGAAPECVAKGVDEIAAKIRALAEENDVPIHSDPPTARALFATTNVGDEIATEHYRPVAAAIRFADAMRAKARRKGWK